MKNKSPILTRIISLIFLIGWMGLIFYMSHQNADSSSGMSGRFIGGIIKLFMPEIDENGLKDIIESLQFFVRKTAHFTVYCGLGVISFVHLSTYKTLSVGMWTFLGLTVSVIYSVSDEYHQTFIGGRSGELRDVLIDTLGALTGVFFALIIYKIYKAIKNKRKPKMKKKQYMELVENLQQRLMNEKDDTENIIAEKNRLARENLSLNSQLEELRQRISALEALNSTAEAVVVAEAVPVTETEKAKEKTDNSIVSEPQLSNGIALGAKIIGKIILSSAEYCNRLIDVGATSNAKELVNLILGRTEVAKAEILRLSALELDQNSVLAAMENELRDAEDYFKSVMAQKS